MPHVFSDRSRHHMLAQLAKLLPIVVLFFAGLGLRRLGWLRRHHGEWMLRLVVTLGLPALILSSLPRIALRPDLAWLPLAAVATVCATGALAVVLGRGLALDRARLGVFVIGPMIMNLAFEYPFVLASWGEPGFAHLVLFDFGNGLLTFTLVYAVAAWYGRGGGDLRHALRGIAAFPPFWAVMVALALNLAGVGMPAPLADVLQGFGRMVVLLVLVALGIYFDPRLWRLPALWLALALRLVLGLVLGAVCVALFRLDGLMRAVVLLGVLAPIGFNTLVYAAREALDREFAASLASLSVLLALAYLPPVLWLLAPG
jgi:predicted permease